MELFPPRQSDGKQLVGSQLIDGPQGNEVCKVRVKKVFVDQPALFQNIIMTRKKKTKQYHISLAVMIIGTIQISILLG